MRRACTLLILTKLAVAVFVSPSVANESLLVVDFPVTEMAEADEMTMTRYRNNPVNLRCDFVNFNTDPLIALVSNLEDGEISIAQSRLLMRFPGGETYEYVGITYEGTQHHGAEGPFLWEGKQEGSGKYFASLVVYKNSGARAYISTEQGMYRLSPSSQTGNYFLCQRDPEYRG